MRFQEVPERLLSSRSGVRTLRVLLAYPEREMTGREIASLAGAPPVRVIERLRLLEWEGLVDRRVVGSAHLWKLDRNHFLAERLGALFQIDSQAQAELRSSLKSWVEGVAGVVEVRLFGSVARHEEKPGSDVDLLVVVSSEAGKDPIRRAFDPLADRVRERFGNPLNVIVLTRREREERKGRGFVGQADDHGELLFAKQGG